jgi:hypothetical protein
MRNTLQSAPAIARGRDAERLAILRAYILSCPECQSQADGLFAQKLKHYRVEWAATLSQARAATTDADGIPLPAPTVPLECA